MASGVKMTKDSMDSLRKSIEALSKKRVLVGIPSEESTRVNNDGSVSPINNAALGYIQEHGSPANNIPARPFLVPGVQGSRETTDSMLGKAGAKMLVGDESGCDMELDKAGLTAASSVKKKMSGGPFQKLADSTLAARARRGVTRTTPLVDTANLQAHITYVKRTK